MTLFLLHSCRPSRARRAWALPAACAAAALLAAGNAAMAGPPHGAPARAPAVAPHVGGFGGAPGGVHLPGGMSGGMPGGMRAPGGFGTPGGGVHLPSGMAGGAHLPAGMPGGGAHLPGGMGAGVGAGAHVPGGSFGGAGRGPGTLAGRGPEPRFTPGRPGGAGFGGAHEGGFRPGEHGGRELGGREPGGRELGGRELGGREPVGREGGARFGGAGAGHPEARPYLHAEEHRDPGRDRAFVERHAGDFHTRDVRAFSARELASWRGGVWRHEWHYGREGWWWDVGGVWYGYPEPIWPYPLVVTELTVYETAFIDTPPPNAVIVEGRSITIPPLPAAPAGRYRCDEPRGFYPAVASCSTPWELVADAPSPGLQSQE